LCFWNPDFVGAVKTINADFILVALNLLFCFTEQQQRKSLVDAVVNQNRNA
jgi:hypothetical protein